MNLPGIWFIYGLIRSILWSYMIHMNHIIYSLPRVAALKPYGTICYGSYDMIHSI